MKSRALKNKSSPNSKRKTQPRWGWSRWGNLPRVVPCSLRTCSPPMDHGLERRAPPRPVGKQSPPPSRDGARRSGSWDVGRDRSPVAALGLARGGWDFHHVSLVSTRCTPGRRAVRGERRLPKSDAPWDHEPSPIRCHDIAKTREPCLPLPGGEGRGDGELS